MNRNHHLYPRRLGTCVNPKIRKFPSDSRILQVHVTTSATRALHSARNSIIVIRNSEENCKKPIVDKRLIQDTKQTEIETCLTRILEGFPNCEEG